MTQARQSFPAPHVWFIAAGVAAMIAVIAGSLWYKNASELDAAAQAYRFKTVEVNLTQPPFDGISTQIAGYRWLSTGPLDIVKSPQPIDLYETITLTLQPLTTGSGCSTSAVSSYAVLLDAPGFTVDRIGAAERTREALLAPSCSLAAQAPPAPAPWRWNLMPTLPGNHVITLVLQSLDKHGAVLNTREDDIPVIVLGQTNSLSAYIGIAGGLVAIVTGLLGVWEKFRGTPAPPPPPQNA